MENIFRYFDFSPFIKDQSNSFNGNEIFTLSEAPNFLSVTKYFSNANDNKKKLIEEVKILLQYFSWFESNKKTIWPLTEYGLMYVWY